ncbi:hypothetical protein GCM10007897_43650 [Sphingobium jiangsuense]|nr:hypothetical protein GCM10007897_43650 [Sphingobium jiangsuense]
MFAVHSIHAPAVEIDETGTYTIDGTTRIKLGEPLFTAETCDEAERLRHERIDHARR